MHHHLLTPLPLVPHVPTYHVFLVPRVRGLAGAAVNHFDTIIPVVGLASLSFGGCVIPDLAVFALRRLQSPVSLPVV